MAQKGNIPRSYMMFQNLNEIFLFWLIISGTTLIVDSSKPT